MHRNLARDTQYSRWAVFSRNIKWMAGRCRFAGGTQHRAQPGWLARKSNVHAMNHVLAGWGWGLILHDN